MRVRSIAPSSPSVPSLRARGGPEAARRAWQAPGLDLVDDRKKEYPMPLYTAENTVASRPIRQDCAGERTLKLWVSGDQLLKGAALNAKICRSGRTGEVGAEGRGKTPGQESGCRIFFGKFSLKGTQPSQNLLSFMYAGGSSVAQDWPWAFTRLRPPDRTKAMTIQPKSAAGRRGIPRRCRSAGRTGRIGGRAAGAERAASSSFIASRT